MAPLLQKENLVINDWGKKFLWIFTWDSSHIPIHCHECCRTAFQVGNHTFFRFHSQSTFKSKTKIKTKFQRKTSTRKTLKRKTSTRKTLKRKTLKRKTYKQISVVAQHSGAKKAAGLPEQNHQQGSAFPSVVVAVVVGDWWLVVGVVVTRGKIGVEPPQSGNPVLQPSQLLNGSCSSLIIKQEFKKVGWEAS